MRPTDLIHNSWKPIFHKLYESPLKDLNEVILPMISYQPEPMNIFRVLAMPLKEVKVILLGQDPYPTPGDAIGLSFVNGTAKVPPSLRIIYEEILNSTGKGAVDIHSWESQGIFLLNTALTVETGKSGSHINYWRFFTEALIKHLSSENPAIWILWGKVAQKYKMFIKEPFVLQNYPDELLDNIPVKDDCNYILEAPHPASETYSGGTSGFYGCNHFNMVNHILKAKGLKEIDW